MWQLYGILNNITQKAGYSRWYSSLVVVECCYLAVGNTMMYLFHGKVSSTILDTCWYYFLHNNVFVLV